MLNAWQWTKQSSTNAHYTLKETNDEPWLHLLVLIYGEWEKKLLSRRDQLAEKLAPALGPFSTQIKYIKIITKAINLLNLCQFSHEFFNCLYWVLNFFRFCQLSSSSKFWPRRLWPSYVAWLALTWIIFTIFLIQYF